MKKRPKDLIDQQEYALHQWRVSLWPKCWKAYPAPVPLAWTVEELSTGKKGSIPERPGIYTLLVQPAIASHPAASFLMYVGQAVNLRKRFETYLTSEKRIRPKLVRLLHTCEGYIHFCYTEISSKSLDTVEDALLEALNPSANSKLPGTVARARRAFE